MRRFQLIGCMLLFVLAGNFYRPAQQPPTAPAAGSHFTTAFFTYRTPPESSSAGHCLHTVFTPEISNGLQSQTPDYRILSKYQSSPACNLASKPQVPSVSRSKSVVPHPAAVDYYIYTLGKIVI